MMEASSKMIIIRKISPFNIEEVVKLKMTFMSNHSGGQSGSLSFVDVNYERILMQRLMEVITQRNRLVEIMDEQNQRKKALGELSRSE